MTMHTPFSVVMYIFLTFPVDSDKSHNICAWLLLNVYIFSLVLCGFFSSLHTQWEILNYFWCLNYQKVSGVQLLVLFTGVKEAAPFSMNLHMTTLCLFVHTTFVSSSFQFFLTENNGVYSHIIVNQSSPPKK